MQADGACARSYATKEVRPEKHTHAGDQLGVRTTRFRAARAGRLGVYIECEAVESCERALGYARQ